MNHFARAVRLALSRRATFAASIACALLVAVLWGGNISAIYPFVEVVFHGQSMPAWVDEQIADGEKTVAQLTEKIETLEARLARLPAPEQRVRFELARARMRRDAEQNALARNRFLQPYLHTWFPQDPFQTLLIILGALLLGTFVKDLFLIGSTILVGQLSEAATMELRVRYYRRILHADLWSLGQNAHGDLMNRFTADIANLNFGLQTLFGRAVREPLKMVACLVGAALVCWRLLILSLIVAPLAAWLMNRLAKSLKRANRRAMEGMSEIYSSLSETLSGIKVVKAFTMERYELRRFQRTARDYYRKAMKIARYTSLISPLNELMGIVMISLAILAGAYLAINQETHLLGIKMSDRPLTLGSLILFYGLLAGVSDPARKLSDVFGRLQQGAAAAERIYEILDRPASLPDEGETLPAPRHRRSIELEDVDFRYSPHATGESKLVLAGINLRIRFGETIAIVGGNGSGKSTLANLILRFYDPLAGRVLLDGVDLRRIRRRDLRRQIGLVSQETQLFDDTVYNNIRYGAPRARREEVVKAARRAHAHRFIVEKLAEGYETQVGTGGQKLSGGQRQRIALARAILRDPSILILDEATSQVDLESEQLIHQVLQEFICDRTTIIITHRLSTLSLADRILVMDQGRIADLGTHEELLARCPFYRRLHQIELRESA